MNRARFVELARPEVLAEVVSCRRLEVELGAKFLAAVQDATARALACPQAGSPAQSETRRVYLKDFPFALNLSLRRSRESQSMRWLIMRAVRVTGATGQTTTSIHLQRPG